MTQGKNKQIYAVHMHSYFNKHKNAIINFPTVL